MIPLKSRYTACVYKTILYLIGFTWAVILLIEDMEESAGCSRLNIEVAGP